jgi:hypothetical protein
MCGDDTAELILEAERIVCAAGWYLEEQIVLDQMAGIKGLARARLEARSGSWGSCRRT